MSAWMVEQRAESGRVGEASFPIKCVSHRQAIYCILYFLFHCSLILFVGSHCPFFIPHLSFLTEKKERKIEEGILKNK